VRILTRNSSGKRAQKFGTRGVEVFMGNMHNPADVRRFLTGAYGCFGVTNFWDPESMGKEEFLGKQMAQIAKEVGVRHFVWSTLPNVNEISGGRYDVPHFTDKAKVNRFVQQLGFQYSTFVMPAFYYQNFGTFFAPKRDRDILTWTLPLDEDKFITAVDIRDMGMTVLQIFNNPQMYNYKEIAVAGEHLHPQDYIIKWALVTRQPAKVVLITPEEHAKTSQQAAKEMGQMFGYFRDHTYYGGKYDWTLGRQINPAMKTWEQYLRSEMQRAHTTSTFQAQ